MDDLELENAFQNRMVPIRLMVHLMSLNHQPYAIEPSTQNLMNGWFKLRFWVCYLVAILLECCGSSSMIFGCKY